MINEPISSNQQLQARMKQLLNIEDEKGEDVDMTKFATPNGLKNNIPSVNNRVEMPSIPTIPNIPTVPNIPSVNNTIQQQPIQQPQQENVIEENVEVERDYKEEYPLIIPQVIIPEEEKTYPKNAVESLNFDEIHDNLMNNYLNMTNEEKFRAVLLLASKDSKRIKTPGTVAAYICKEVNVKSVNSRRVLEAVNGKPMDGLKTQKCINFFWTNEVLREEYPDVLNKIVQLDLFSWVNKEKK